MFYHCQPSVNRSKRKHKLYLMKEWIYFLNEEMAFIRATVFRTDDDGSCLTDFIATESAR